jgi:hypothetical protein
MATTQQCKNCENLFDPSFDYCPYCGQESADNLTFGVLFSKTISDYFSIDARFFRSFGTLMLKPGVLARRFVDGKRLKYLHPAQFYLFISVIFFFLFSFSIREADSEMSEAFEKTLDKEILIDSLPRTEIDSINLVKAKELLKKNQRVIGMSEEDIEAIDSVMSAPKTMPKLEIDGLTFGFKREVLDSLIAVGAPNSDKYSAMGMKEDANGLNRRIYEQILKLYEKKGGGILQTFYDMIPIAMFLLMPLFALLLKIFYWKSGNFAHHMVFSFYFFTFIFTTYSLILVANKIIDVPLEIQIMINLSFNIYLFIALRNFYRGSWFGSILKSGVMSFIYMLFILPLASVGIVFMAFMLY